MSTNMTNRERAWALIKEEFKHTSYDEQDYIEFMLNIERALDEVQIEHQQRGYISGFAMGQREMRERATKTASQFCVDKPEIQMLLDRNVNDIRALPIEGE